MTAAQAVLGSPDLLPEILVWVASESLWDGRGVAAACRQWQVEWIAKLRREQRLKPDAALFREAPGFAPIPTERIGTAGFRAQLPAC